VQFNLKMMKEMLKDLDKIRASLRKTRRDIKGAAIAVNFTCAFSIRFSTKREGEALISECITQYA